MQMINDMFTGHLSKFGAKVVDEDVYVEFVITHISKNEPDQDFLDNFSEEFANNANRSLTNPQWDNVKFGYVIPQLDIKFDSMEIVADLQAIKISQKDTEKDLIFKYDLVFLKKQEKDIDTWFQSYLKHKDETDEGKKVITEYDVEITSK